MKSTFDDIIEQVLIHEGGYVHHPADRGGETKFGISKAAHPDVDVANLTQREAIEIYHQEYWQPSRAAALSQGLRHIYFDMVVNHGQANAVKMLQRAIARFADSCIAIDGRIGPKTIKAAAYLRPEFMVLERIRFFHSIVENDPSQEVFLKGWITRSLDFLTS